jgi:Transient receptor potential (TRP) ion channel/ML-like domain
MRLGSLLASAAVLVSAPLAAAQGVLQTNSLNACPGSTNSGFTATLFDVVYTSNNNTITFNINAISSISQKVKAQIEVIAYGLVLFNQTFDPCTDSQLASLCPLNPGPINLNSNKQLGSGGPTSSVPTIAYTWPDLDGTVRAYITDHDDPSIQLACVEAELSNGKTVNQLGVKWATAVVSGLALVVSAVVSGLGHSNTAAHIASNALSLFGFFQSQALLGMTAVAMPPMAESWTQDFQWTMGIIGVDFMQDVCTWYQRATGGTPSTILGNLQNVSVEVQKRGLQGLNAATRLAARGLSPFANRHLTTVARRGVKLAQRGLSTLQARAAQATSSQNQQEVVAGIERVGFKANIEPTNIFLTGLGIFVAFIVLVVAVVSAFKGWCELASKRGWMKQDKFADFRNGWKIVLKGILFRIVLIGYAQMAVLCLWELTVRDSAAEVVVAIFYFLAMSGVLFWAALKVVRIARRSVALHKNPAYILYSDPTALNKWGFLYVQYRATAYYFIIPQLGYILCKAVFVALAQSSPIAQAIGFLIIEAGWLIAVSIIRPWMDKKTNGMNIAIAAMSFLSAVCLLIFTQVFNQPVSSNPNHQ